MVSDPTHSKTISDIGADAVKICPIIKGQTDNEERMR